jgi:hypothetical protein
VNISPDGRSGHSHTVLILGNCCQENFCHERVFVDMSDFTHPDGRAQHKRLFQIRRPIVKI